MIKQNILDDRQVRFSKTKNYLIDTIISHIYGMHGDGNKFFCQSAPYPKK